MRNQLKQQDGKKVTLKFDDTGKILEEEKE